MESSSFIPDRHFCDILSITMIELSTIIPVPRTNPDKEMMLSEIPNRWNANRVMTKDRGMVTTINIGERRSFINRKMTSAAKIPPTNRLLPRLSIE